VGGYRKGGKRKSYSEKGLTKRGRRRGITTGSEDRGERKNTVRKTKKRDLKQNERPSFERKKDKHQVGRGGEENLGEKREPNPRRRLNCSPRWSTGKAKKGEIADGRDVTFKKRKSD